MITGFAGLKDPERLGEFRFRFGEDWSFASSSFSLPLKTDCKWRTVSLSPPEGFLAWKICPTSVRDNPNSFRKLMTSRRLQLFPRRKDEIHQRYGRRD